MDVKKRMSAEINEVLLVDNSHSSKKKKRKKKHDCSPVPTKTLSHFQTKTVSKSPFTLDDLLQKLQCATFLQFLKETRNSEASAQRVKESTHF